MSAVSISTKSYSYHDFSIFLKGSVKVRVDSEVQKIIKDSRDRFNKILHSKEKIYGVNTGFGKLSQMTISESDQKKLQLNLIRSHAVGVGKPINPGITRILLFLKILTFAKGFSGVRYDVVDQILKLLHHDILPIIPRQGSVGASGDLAPLAHMSLALIGESEVIYKNRRMSSLHALKKVGMKPLILQAKEGLSLINGTQYSTALAISCLIKAQNLLITADISGALTTEASLSSRKNYLPSVHRLKKHKSQIQTATNIWNILENSEIVLSHKNCDRMQDPYSIRCIPQVHGACREMVKNASIIINNEINSVSDNPLVLKNNHVLNSGHFHGEFIAQAMDSLSIAMSEIGSISQKRIHYVMKGIADIVPQFVAHNPGLESGLMLAHVTTAALASENKTLSHPASVDSISTSGGQEDFVSMSPGAAMKALSILENVKNILAIELFVSVKTSINFHQPLNAGKGCNPVIQLLKKHIKFEKGDQLIYKDIELISDFIEKEKILTSVQKKVILSTL